MLSIQKTWLFVFIIITVIILPKIWEYSFTQMKLPIYLTFVTTSHVVIILFGSSHITLLVSSNWV